MTTLKLNIQVPEIYQNELSSNPAIIESGVTFSVSISETFLDFSEILIEKFGTAEIVLIMQLHVPIFVPGLPMELAIKPCDVFACRVITEMIVLVIIIAYMEVVSQPEETRVCVTQDITEIIVPKLVIAVKMAPVARTGRVCVTQDITEMIVPKLVIAVAMAHVNRTGHVYVTQDTLGSLVRSNRQTVAMAVAKKFSIFYQ